MRGAAAGWVSGFLGVATFAGSLPATRLAVADFDPVFLTAARATIAAALGLMLLAALRQPPPAWRDLPSLALTACGVVIGFPLLTALALQHISSARSIVFVGMLPLCTALFGVLRAGERPRPAFWLFSAVGGGCVAAYALGEGGQAAVAGDALMVAAVIVCGLGYAEGARLARTLGVPFQHADRLRILVSGAGVGRDCGGWTASVAPTLHGIGPGRGLARRGRQLRHGGGDARRSGLRRRRETFCGVNAARRTGNWGKGLPVRAKPGQYSTSRLISPRISSPSSITTRKVFALPSRLGR